MARLPSFLPRLWSNWLTLLGSIVATISGLAILFTLAVELASSEGNRYSSTVLFLALPAVFVFGLLLIPVGLFVERRRKPSESLQALSQAWASVLANRTVRNKLVFIAIATVVNVLIFGVAGHKAVTYMDSPKFCGTTCHTVMEPEWTAYNRSSHSRVACVECHIGPGATWAVRSKIDGIRQVIKVSADSYERPIPTPVETLRPSRDTCERCHWPQKFHGNKLAIYPHYGDDEKNTPAYNAVLLKVGGLPERGSELQGIHWHVSPDVQVRYEPLDDKRETIGRVTVTKQGKVVAEYLPPEGEPAQQGRAERVMDCIDCHNRPTHTFAHSAADAVDQALDQRQLDPAVPYLRQVAVQALSEAKAEGARAEPALRKALQETFQKLHPEAVPSAQVLDTSARTLAQLYQRNVFPAMKVTWGTYPSHLGHREEEGSPGCFRCHDGQHETAAGKKLGKSCSLCHAVVATDEDPANFSEPLRLLLGQPEPASK